MKGFIFAFTVSGFLTSTKGQCQSNDGKSLIASCVGSAKYGPAVYVDFYKINRPCTCIVTPSFVGDLLVVSRKVIVSVCNTQIVINKMFVMGCSLQYVSSQLLNVNINQPVDVRAEYSSQYTSGTCYHCIGFQQNGGMNGNLSVVCGSPLATALASTTTTTTTKARESTPTIIVTTPTANLRLSSVVSSTEPTSALYQNDVNVTETTATTMSKECICGHKDEVSGESLLSLQIPLAIFVVISIVSAITNLSFFIHIKLRTNSGSKTSNVNTSIRTETETTAETYTELGNTVSENQYDSLSSQDNYMNTNV